MLTGGERLRVVLDTNVLVSGLNYSGTPSRLLRLLLQAEMAWYISPFILDELRRILAEKFRWDEQRIDQAVQLILGLATVLDPPRSVAIIQEKDGDNRILECALHATAHYLVSGDKHHLLPVSEFRDTKIVSPAAFVDMVLRGR